MHTLPIIQLLFRTLPILGLFILFWNVTGNAGTALWMCTFLWLTFLVLSALGNTLEAFLSLNPVLIVLNFLGLGWLFGGDDGYE